LEALRFNENHDKKRLGGFAIGAERLVQFLIGCYDMKYVQLFPTNLPNGILTHATSIEDMKTRRKKL
jgi:aspartyl-tRNA synthetase